MPHQSNASRGPRRPTWRASPLQERANLNPTEATRQRRWASPKDTPKANTRRRPLQPVFPRAFGHPPCLFMAMSVGPPSPQCSISGNAFPLRAASVSAALTKCLRMRLALAAFGL